MPRFLCTYGRAIDRAAAALAPAAVRAAAASYRSVATWHSNAPWAKRDRQRADAGARAARAGRLTGSRDRGLVRGVSTSRRVSRMYLSGNTRWLRGAASVLIVTGSAALDRSALAAPGSSAERAQVIIAELEAAPSGRELVAPALGHARDRLGRAQAASVPALTVNWCGDEAVTHEEYLAYLASLIGVEPTYAPISPGLASRVCDPARRASITGPCRIDWRTGMREMVERRRITQGGQTAEFLANLQTGAD